MEYDGMIPLMYELCHPGSTAGSKAWMDARWEPPSAWKSQPGFPRKPRVSRLAMGF